MLSFSQFITEGLKLVQGDKTVKTARLYNDRGRLLGSFDSGKEAYAHALQKEKNGHNIGNWYISNDPPPKLKKNDLRVVKEELFLETIAEVDGSEVEYIRNPGKSGIKRMLDKATEDEWDNRGRTLRYYYDIPSDSTYIWDAYDSTHGTFGWAMGLDWRAGYNEGKCLTGFIHPKELEEIQNTSAPFKDWIKTRHDRAKGNQWKGCYIPDSNEGYSSDEDKDSNFNTNPGQANTREKLQQAKVAASGPQGKIHYSQPPNAWGQYPRSQGDVKVSAHTRDGSQVHAYTRHRPK